MKTFHNLILTILLVPLGSTALADEPVDCGAPSRDAAVNKACKKAQTRISKGVLANITDDLGCSEEDLDKNVQTLNHEGFKAWFLAHCAKKSEAYSESDAGKNIAFVAKEVLVKYILSKLNEKKWDEYKESESNLESSSGSTAHPPWLFWCWWWSIAWGFLIIPIFLVWRILPEKCQKWRFIASVLISMVLAYGATFLNLSGIGLATFLIILVGGSTFLFWKSGGFKKSSKTPPPPTSNTVTCSACGSQSSGKFCGDCGNELTQPAATTPTTAPSGETANPSPAQDTPKDPPSGR